MDENSEIKMSVSMMTRTKDSKAVYVLFEDGSRSAEFALPDGKLLSNSGFTDEEITRLKDYLDSERDSVFKMAQKINPLRDMLSLK